ncbi:indolepyruvate oxidoreductase subunit beta [Thermoplasma sp.]|uniref:indolepyruvate oxidoreductase subunit beta n=1 Tax=Thermoplasma sp. TaxID=1973142 RepID=UPI001289BA86|nr:indolepyruvate oxidoreductase subunit beta [Thermoplasma sp.]KAA8923028.1 MAG: indolepyruvate oxidoreductase subunit beta [Thermoplasma sp.]
MERINILLTGVGGQGIITMGKMIGNAAVNAGVKVLVAETHGLSQRGGSVQVHIRIGDVIAPLIEKGRADFIVGLEASEVLRNLSYANKSTVFILNRQTIKPVVPSVNAPDIDAVVEKLQAFSYYIVDGEEMAKDAGNPKGSNAVIIGFMLGMGFFGKIPREAFEKAMITDLNRKCLNAGYSQALTAKNNGGSRPAITR